MSAWLKRFGLHMAAAVGATGIFVAAAAVGANQTRQQVAAIVPAEVVTASPVPTPGARRKPSVVASPAPRRGPSPAPSPAAAPAAENVVPERSLAGTIKDVRPDGIDIVGVGGREWRIAPVPGALIRLNGRGTRLDALNVGDTVVILGQAQAREGSVNRFLAHAITARRN